MLIVSSEKNVITSYCFLNSFRGPWLRDLIDKLEPQTVGDKIIHPEDVLFPQPESESVLGK